MLSYGENHPWFAAMVGEMLTFFLFHSCATSVHCNHFAIPQCEKIIILSHLSQCFITFITPRETPTIILMKTCTSELWICRKYDHNKQRYGKQMEWESLTTDISKARKNRFTPNPLHDTRHHLYAVTHLATLVTFCNHTAGVGKWEIVSLLDERPYCYR